MTQVLDRIRDGSIEGPVTVSQWDGRTCSDVVVCPPDLVQRAKLACPSSAVLASIDGVAARFSAANGLPHGLERDPDSVAASIDSATTACREEVSRVAKVGADGVSYLVFGADPENTSPMQYGGFFLERDREIMGEAMAGMFVEALIAPAEETYFDFLTDLPCDLVSAPAATSEQRASISEATASKVSGGQVSRIYGEVAP